ncbi:MAG: RepA protein [Spirosoma sp.]|nr:RepA protein [Spirosoma sp.]
MDKGSKYKKLKEFEAFEENPFIEKAVDDIKIIKRTQVIRPQSKDEIQMITSTEGEVTGYTAFMRFVEVDEERFAKVYLSQFSSFWDLSKPAIRVFGYILTVLKPRQDSFMFDMADCLTHTKYSTEKSVFEGLSSLIECGIVARGNRHYRYFINPLVVFNGDRVTFAKTYVKKRKEKNNSLPENQLNLFIQPNSFTSEPEKV